MNEKGEKTDWAVEMAGMQVVTEIRRITFIVFCFICNLLHYI